MNFIEELSKKRQKWIEANRENNFEEGIKNLLTELYPDNAHFIYELLQNAEDAQATKVKFILNAEGLEFQHNGKRQFSEDDIESITSIGQSTKKDDFNQIGKFGVGFKAVFSYTQTPQVFSGKYAFEIQDLVCPKEIPQISQISNGKSNATFFCFPFNHYQKTKDKAVQEIEKTLINLPDNTILFLHNIKEILWEIEKDGKQSGFIKRSEMKKPNCFEIKKKTDKIHKTYWLRFTKKIPQKKGLFVAIAFRLITEKPKRDSKKIIYKIDKEVQKGDVSIFFPAEKETSNLKFYLHAPFAATVARDSIRTQSDNLELRDLLVKLLVESLPKIKKSGLLDDNFLAILPTGKVELPEFYIPFRDKIIEAFQNGIFTPTWNNNYLPAKNLIQAESEIKQIINKSTILDYLMENEDIDWAIDAEKNSRKYNLLEEFGVKELTWRELLEKVCKLFSNNEKADEILSEFSDEWLQNFYVLLGKAKEKTYHYLPIKNANIVRLQNGNHTDGKNKYFQTELVTDSKSISIVKPTIYQSNKDENHNEKAKKFLEFLGVNDFSEKEEIKLILKQHYENEPKITEKENIKHLNKFIKFLNDNSEESSIFKDYNILKIEDNNEVKYCQPSEIFLDEPYEKTYLSSIENLLIDFGSKIWTGYSTKIKNQKNFVNFLKSIGVKYKLEILETKISKNHPDFKSLKADLTKGARENSNSTNKDYNIENLYVMLREKNREISRLIWETISKTDRDKLKAKFKPNKKYEERSALSQFIYKLKQYAWIPDKKGNFNKPQDISREMLPDDFPYNNGNGWLSAIEFGTQTEKSKLNEKQKIERFANQFNLTIQQAEKALEFAKMSDEEKAVFEEFKQQKKIVKQQKVNVETNSIKTDISPNKGNEETEKIKEIPKISTEYEKKPEIYIPPYEIEYLVKSRPYQRDFKNRLKNLETKCRVTGITNIELLIASHIKPVRDCTDDEKVDANNGFLLSPHVDKLFDKGWISFTDDGNILCSNEIVKEVMKVWGLEINKSVGTFNEKQKEYLVYHRKKFGFEK